ncbi:hypothetical protein K6V98_00700 [Collinsella sp. AGMB00827]|uniref:Uncharacterized protein n=1 Tax=Collinsella ureilytica TaxID=2869515 RepID=A0ABS7MHQ1_9ACTN|nr:hypothetical protein [Collinsella urealyticum]MBY4796886.1 hypothetical protein [Collinsella urealyticum]
MQELGRNIYLDPSSLDALARAAWPGEWTAHALRIQLALALRTQTHRREHDLLNGDKSADQAPSDADSHAETTTLATGLFTQDGSPLIVELAPTQDDIPLRLTYTPCR